MPRVLSLAFVAAWVIATASAEAALITDNLGTAKRISLEQLPLSDKGVWDDYGLVEAETARFEGGKPFAVSAWRLKDPTGAQAAFRWLRPAEAKPGDANAISYTSFAAVSGNTQWIAYGNYLLKVEGRPLTLDELKILLFQLPKVDQSGLPPVLEYLPQDGLKQGSDRFISGPASLEKFYPKVPPSTAGFHFGTEAVVGRYRGRGTEMEMAVFYYPTNPMARDREPEFRKLQQAMVKRSGPLVAVIIAPSSPDDAERLLAQINYKANVTLNEGAPGSKIHSVGNLLVSIFVMVGVLAALCIMAGIMMYGARLFRRRLAGGKDDDPMTMLRIDR